MAFYIYQNFPNKKVKIHLGQCRFCNYGQGLQRNLLGEANGKWHISPNNGYQTYELALDNAHSLALPMGINAQNCKVCQPDSHH